MSGVYNRKLFQKSAAREQLRNMGGIMASSEELLREAMKTAASAPRASDLGPMPRMSAMPPVMQQPQPMMPQPMMPQPMMPMPQPMMPMQQPMDPMMQEPAFMPPQVPESAMMAPAAFAEGGPVRSLGVEQGGFGGRFGGGFMPPMAIPGGASTVPAPEEGFTRVDITRPAGEVLGEVDEETAAVAEDLATRVDEEDPEAIGAEIVDTAAKKGAEVSGDLQADLARIYQNLTGDPAAFEKNIDALNRGIIGAAIGAGTSARATENISKGLLVGLEAARNTEERRAAQAANAQLAMLQAAGRGTGRGAAAGAGSRDYRNPIDAYQDAYSQVMNAGEFDIEVPEGLTREQYAEQTAAALVARSYTPEQLVGTPFEGMAVAGGGATPAPAPGGEQTAADLLAQARAAIAAGADEELVRSRLESLGIDPGSL